MLDNAIEPLTDLLPPTATTLAVTTATMNVVELLGLTLFAWRGAPSLTLLLTEC